MLRKIYKRKENAIIMIKDTDIITVIDSNVLFDNDNKTFKEFASADRNDSTYIADFENIILNKSRPMMHGIADRDITLKQILACVFIVDTNKGLISAYKTAASSKDSITASTGSWSCGYRNHIKSLKEATDNPFVTDTIFHTRLEDLKKEILPKNGSLDIKNSWLLGYTNNNFHTYIQSHFTLIYALRTDANEIYKAEDAIYNKMITLDELADKIRLSDIPASGTSVDIWTKQSFKSLVEYVKFFQSFNNHK